MCVQNHRNYDADFKRNAVFLAREPGRSIPDVAENLGINKDLIYRWRRQLQKTGGIAFSGNGRMALTEERKRIRELEKRLKETEMERDILKKAMTIFSRAPE